jgi:tRNA dimethylallyltransferase
VKKKQIDRVILTGPTASGKSDLALELCEEFPNTFEIISADSVQVYRGLNIGSGKVAASRRERVTHYMIDIRNPDESFDLSQFCTLASEYEKEIKQKGKIPLFVGGTLLYLSSYFEGHSAMPESDPILRKRLLDEMSNKSTVYLHERLDKVDPDSAKRIHPNDSQRVIRALEVFEISGKPMSYFRGQKKGHLTDNSLYFALVDDREKLYESINRRFDTMIALGFVSEVEDLIKKGYSEKSQALSSIGYSQIVKYLSGMLSLEEAVSEAKKMTRKYAKKQITWINGNNSCIKIEQIYKNDIKKHITKFLEENGEH